MHIFPSFDFFQVFHLLLHRLPASARVPIPFFKINSGKWHGIVLCFSFYFSIKWNDFHLVFSNHKYTSLMTFLLCISLLIFWIIDTNAFMNATFRRLWNNIRNEWTNEEVLNRRTSHVLSDSVNVTDAHLREFTDLLLIHIFILSVYFCLFEREIFRFLNTEKNDRDSSRN